MARIYVYGILCAACFGCGWTVHGWKVDSENASATKAVQEAELAISAQLEEKLSGIKANQTEVRHEVTKFIERPVYLNECFDIDGMLLVNRSKSGAAKPAN